MQFKTALRELMDKQGMKAAELAQKSGVSEGSISEYLSGKKEPLGKTAIKLATALGVSLDSLLRTPFSEKVIECKTANKHNDALLTEKEQKISRAYGKASSREQEIVEYVLEPYMEISSELVPELPDDEEEMIDMKVYFEASAAGSGDYLTDSDSYEILSLPVDEVPARADFGVRIVGQSMEPFIEDGSIAWVEYMPSVNSGDIGIFILNGDSYCKKLDVDTKDRKVWLLSLNEKSDDIEVGDEDDLRTVGKVLL